jgi:hypothetical protein
MNELSTTKRMELELAILKIAIDLANDYGEAGIDFFCQQFPARAKEYVQALEKEIEEENNINEFFPTAE